MRNVSIATVLLALASASFTGCGSKDSAAAAPAVAAPNVFTLASDPYTLEAGTEKYFCYAHTVDEDFAAIAVDVTAGQLVHHLAVFETAKGSMEPEGFSECVGTIKETWLPLYGGGVKTPGMKLPDDAAFKFAKGSQILMQLHLLNATAASVTEKTSVQLTKATDPDARKPAGIFAMGNRSFTLPAHGSGIGVEGKCTMTRDLDVFAVFPHMHRLGTKIQLDHGPTEAEATTLYSIDPWNFGDQPMGMMKFKVNTGDFVRASCSFNNTTDGDVIYGESTKDEMCFVVMFYTPFDHVDGCVELVSVACWSANSRPGRVGVAPSARSRFARVRPTNAN